MALWASPLAVLCYVEFKSFQNLAPFWICFLKSLHWSRDSSTWMCPPDPINYFCSLTGIYISQKNFTYRSVQIFKMLFQGFYAPESDPLHKITRCWFYFSTRNWNWNMELWHGTGTGTWNYDMELELEHCWVVDFHLINVIRRKCFLTGLYQLQQGKSEGLALKCFNTIHRVGRTFIMYCWSFLIL